MFSSKTCNQRNTPLVFKVKLTTIELAVKRLDIITGHFWQ